MSAFCKETQTQSIIQSPFFAKATQSNHFPEFQAVQHRGTIARPTGARTEAHASTSGTPTSASAPYGTGGKTASKVGRRGPLCEVMCARLVTSH